MYIYIYIYIYINSCQQAVKLSLFGIKNFSFTKFFVCFSFQVQQDNSFLI